MDSSSFSVKGTWSKLAPSHDDEFPPPIGRSSHGLAVIGRRLFVFGGENVPREPVGNDVHVFDRDSCRWSIGPCKGEPPVSCVGVGLAAIGETIFVFGGRNDKHEETNALFSYDTRTGEWKNLTPKGEPSPPARSYHSLVADESRSLLFTFGGCGTNGRLNDLWKYDVMDAHWLQLPSPPEGSTCVPRGGPGLIYTDDAIWVFFGFCGQELGDVHRFDLQSQEWEEVKCQELIPTPSPYSGSEPSAGINLSQIPSPRSVLFISTVQLQAPGAVSNPNGTFVVMYGGEVDPSDLGHLGAGEFSNEVFVFHLGRRAFLRVPMSSDDKGTQDYRTEKALGDFSVGNPGARGWGTMAACGDGRCLVYGGINDKNERLKDLFQLDLDFTGTL